MLKIYIEEQDLFPTCEVLDIFKAHDLAASVTRHKFEADILFVRLKKMINDDYLDHFNSLKIIVSPTTGLNHINTSSLENRGIKLYSLRGETLFLKNITPTADLAFTCILSSFTRLTLASHDTAYNHRFDRNVHFRAAFKNLRVGFVGMGRLGSIVSKYVQNIGGYSGYYDPYVDQSECVHSVKLPSLNSLFQEFDLISVHAIANNETDSLIKLQHMMINPPYTIINTSRASIMPSHTIENGFSQGLLTQVFVDTLDEEPLSSPHDIIDTHLYKLQQLYGPERIIITPHIGGACNSSLRQCELFLSSKVASDVSGRF